MKLRFDLQFFGGGGGGSATQYRKRDPEPQELQDLRLNLYNKILPGIQSFDPNSWAKAQEISDNAMGKMNGLIDQMPGTLTQGNRFLEGLEGVLTTGDIPTGVTDKLNAGVDKSLQSSMGNMLNGLAKKNPPCGGLYLWYNTTYKLIKTEVSIAHATPANLQLHHNRQPCIINPHH